MASDLAILMAARVTSSAPSHNKNKAIKNSAKLDIAYIKAENPISNQEKMSG